MGFFQKISLVKDAVNALGEMNQAQNAQAQNTQASSNSSFDSTVLYFANMISITDSDVMDAMASCITNPQGFYHSHQAQYEKIFVDGSNEEDIKWSGLIMTLEENHYGYVLSNDCSRENFINHFTTLQGIQKLSLPVEEEWLGEYDGAFGWMRTLESKWENQNACICIFDDGSEEGLTFVTTLGAAEKMIPMSREIGYKIVRATM